MFTLNEAAYGRRSFADKLSFTKDGARLYLRPDGTAKRPGDPVTNPDLAATLRTLAREGAASFYTGQIAAKIVADMRAHNGLLSAEDLQNFRVREHAPLSVAYRGRRIAVPPPPAGGVVVAEMLRILERFDISPLPRTTAPPTTASSPKP